MYLKERFYSPRMKIYFLTATLLLFFLFGSQIPDLLASANTPDIDDDGFIGEQSGGNDCVDSLQSKYITSTQACNPNSLPTFLESKVDPDSDDDIADHAWIQDDSGLYHLFFQNEDQGYGDYIEHYTATDLQSLTYVGPALMQNPAGWDSYGLWAPYVIKNPAGSLYYMFYSGVTAGGSDPDAEQRIGVATSPDLTTWTKYPLNNCLGTAGDGCVYDCNESWTRWGSGEPYDNQCRDPFVIRDEVNNRWLMFMTVNSNIGLPAGQMISVAQSPDLINWAGAGYILATKKLYADQGGVGLQLTGHVAENPFVTEYNNNFYLFFTDYTDQEDYYNIPNPRTEIQYLSSPDLSVDDQGSLNWAYRGSIPDPGVNASEIVVPYGDTWIMSQSIAANPYSGDWPTHTRDLRLKRMIWNDDGTFTTSNLTKLSCRVASGDINPDATEVCSDGIDNDCNGQIDDPALCDPCVDNDHDGYGTSGFALCPYSQPDCNDDNINIYSGATEYCDDGVDSNCDGLDNGPGCVVLCIDRDGDDYGTAGLEACEYVQPDCNDNNQNIHPGALEICDGLDNNCNSQIDEGGVCPRPRKIKWEICDVPDDMGGGACYIYYY
ncbi:MAG: hypothetical protein C3F02_03955 [Parcubacteria group bacterium]|nr:MAG: hypothetical protein C3F02_03955 [Parcubacteria group bacterium]